MKWKVEQPVPGDKRLVRKFAWFPTEVEGYKVWLETYQTEETYFGKIDGWIESSEWVYHDGYQMRLYPKRKLLQFYI